ncbi:MAG: hypothetical protein ACI30W_05755, partial [Muribaculaceae bacterium]
VFQTLCLYHAIRGLAPPATAQQPYRLPWFCLSGNISLTADMRALRTHRRTHRTHRALRVRSTPTDAATAAPAPSELSECSESAVAANFRLKAVTTASLTGSLCISRGQGRRGRPQPSDSSPYA